jgi:hypothetical protein
MALLAGEADELGPVPLATVVKVYDVPFVRPVTVHDVAGKVTVQVLVPGLEVTT